MARIDYDAVAPLYDEPIRDHPPDPMLQAFLDAKAGILAPPLRVLDVACGTGKQVASNRAHFQSVLHVGLDRSLGMLRIAQRRCPGAGWLRADGARLPFPSKTFHYATCQFAYHHVGHTATFLAEVFRVLASGGRFVMTNIDPWSMLAWAVYRYFPEALERDEQDFTPVDRFSALMQDAGFRDLRMTREDLSRRESVAQFLEYARGRHRASQFTAISDTAYAAGLGRLEDAVAGAGSEDASFSSQFVLVTISGDKP